MQKKKKDSRDEALSPEAKDLRQRERISPRTSNLMEFAQLDFKIV